MKVIHFKDKGFEKVIRDQFNISKEYLSIDDLQKVNGVMITDQDVSGFGVPWHSDSSAFNMTFPNLIFNISRSENGEWELDLKHFQHIKTLHIYVPTQDLTVLDGFIGLKELYVKNSATADWSFISSLKNLKYLYLVDCQFQDLTSIGILYKSQYELYKEEAAKKKENQFHIFQGISHLGLVSCNISDISPIKDCKLIDQIDFSHNSISDISPLNGIDALYYLTLRHNKIEDVTPLKDLGMIYYINLRHNSISNISIFSSYKRKNLRRLFLGHNDIEDFSPLKGLRLIATDIPFER